MATKFVKTGRESGENESGEADCLLGPAAEQRKIGDAIDSHGVVEGERSCKNLHLHFAIGGLPNYIKFNKFDALVKIAKLQVEHIDAEHKVDICDSGWLEYLTKELGTKDTDNVLWTLA